MKWLYNPNLLSPKVNGATGRYNLTSSQSAWKYLQYEWISELSRVCASISFIHFLNLLSTSRAHKWMVHLYKQFMAKMQMRVYSRTLFLGLLLEIVKVQEANVSLSIFSTPPTTRNIYRLHRKFHHLFWHRYVLRKTRSHLASQLQHQDESILIYNIGLTRKIPEISLVAN